VEISRVHQRCEAPVAPFKGVEATIPRLSAEQLAAAVRVYHSKVTMLIEDT
jgi:hypothetical protein